MAARTNHACGTEHLWGVRAPELPVLFGVLAYHRLPAGSTSHLCRGYGGDLALLSETFRASDVLRAALPLLAWLTGVHGAQTIAARPMDRAGETGGDRGDHAPLQVLQPPRRCGPGLLKFRCALRALGSQVGPIGRRCRSSSQVVRGADRPQLGAAASRSAEMPQMYDRSGAG